MHVRTAPNWLLKKKKTQERHVDIHVESQFQLKRRRKFPPSDTTTNRGRPRVAKRDAPTPRGSSINCAQFNVCYVSSITRTKTRRKEDCKSWEEMGRGRHARYFTRFVSRPPLPLESGSLFNSITTCAVSSA